MRQLIVEADRQPATSRTATRILGGVMAAAVLSGIGCRSSLQTAQSRLPSQQVTPEAVGLRSDAEYRSAKTPSAVAKSGGAYAVRQVGHAAGRC